MCQPNYLSDRDWDKRTRCRSASNCWSLELSLPLEAPPGGHSAVVEADHLANALVSLVGEHESRFAALPETTDRCRVGTTPTALRSLESPLGSVLSPVALRGRLEHTSGIDRSTMGDIDCVGISEVVAEVPWPERSLGNQLIPDDAEHFADHQLVLSEDARSSH